MNRIELHVASEEPLSVRRFHVSEGVSQPFVVTAVAHAENPALELEPVVGRPARFRLLDDVHGGRMWSGICSAAREERAVSLAKGDALSTYRFEIVPALWLLSRRKNHRIFRHLSVIEIVERPRRLASPCDLRGRPGALPASPV